MIDHSTMLALRQEIAHAIEDGMKAGAAHVAEALAKPTPGTAAFEPFGPDVTIAELKLALLTLRQAYCIERGGDGVAVYDPPVRNRLSRERVGAAWATVFYASGPST